MRRRLFTFAAVVSLLLFVATMVLWIRSEKRVSAIFYYKDGVTTAMALLEGGIEFSRQGAGEPGESPVSVATFDDDIQYLETNNGDPTITLFLYGRPIGWRIPLWLFALAQLVLPSAWIIKEAKRRGRRGNLCPKCRYDLTGNTSGVCPECGTPVEGVMKVST